MEVDGEMVVMLGGLLGYPENPHPQGKKRKVKGILHEGVGRSEEALERMRESRKRGRDWEWYFDWWERELGREWTAVEISDVMDTTDTAARKLLRRFEAMGKVEKRLVDESRGKGGGNWFIYWRKVEDEENEGDVGDGGRSKGEE